MESPSDAFWILCYLSHEAFLLRELSAEFLHLISSEFVAISLQPLLFKRIMNILRFREQIIGFSSISSLSARWSTKNDVYYVCYSNWTWWGGHAEFSPLPLTLWSWVNCLDIWGTFSHLKQEQTSLLCGLLNSSWGKIRMCELRSWHTEGTADGSVRNFTMSHSFILDLNTCSCLRADKWGNTAIFVTYLMWFGQNLQNSVSWDSSVGWLDLCQFYTDYRVLRGENLDWENTSSN